MNRILIAILLGLLSLNYLNCQKYYSFNESKKNKIIIYIESDSYEDITNLTNIIKSRQDFIDYEIDLVFDDLDDYLDNVLISNSLLAINFLINRGNDLKVSISEKEYPLPVGLYRGLSGLNEKEIAYTYPLKVSGIRDEHPLIDKFYKIKTPSIIFEGDVDLEKRVEELLIKSNNFRSSIHLKINFLDRVYYLNEKILLLITSSFILLLFTLIFFYSRRIKFHIKQNRKYIFTLILKAGVLFIFFYISTLVFELLLDITSDGNLLRNFPKSFFFIKILITVFIYGICFHVIKDTSFSKSPYFYSYIAFFLSISSFLILIFIDLPMGIYQIIPLIIIILFIISKHRSSKRFFLLLSPLLLILFFNMYLTGNNREFIDLFLYSRYRGNIVLTILTLPYFFLQDSYHRFVTRRQNKIIYKQDIVFSVITLVFTSTYIAILLELNNR